MIDLDLLEKLFNGVLNMSLTASIMILAVLAVRMALRKAPRIFSYMLWSVVLFRLLCPISFSSDFSLLGALGTGTASQGRMEYITENRGVVENVRWFGSETLEAEKEPVEKKGKRREAAIFLGSIIWFSGICLMLGYSLWVLIKLRREMKHVELERDNIYVGWEVTTPFVYGVFSPKIYLPKDLEQKERDYILLHEQIHIKRGDYLIRLISWLALCVHWFNPFVWLAFFISERDMEMACDEAVLYRLGNEVKKEYSRSLMALAAGEKSVRVPLGFGMGGVKQRIKNILHYRKPKLLVTGFAIVATVAVAGFLMANPDEIPVVQEAVPNEEEELKPEMVVKPVVYHPTIRSISREERCISDMVYTKEGDGTVGEGYHYKNQEKQYFSEDCIFKVNYTMDKIQYEEVSFDTFADLIEESDPDVNKLCELLVEEGLIVEVALKNGYYNKGINFSPKSEEDTWYEHIQQRRGETALEDFYTLVRTERADVSDTKGEEVIEIYSGNIGDGDSGIIIVYNEAGDILYTESAHTSRAGWNNIYLGEAEGKAFLLTVHIEDRGTFGGYDYQVFRLGEKGEIRQIAGSSFEFGEYYLYDDALFKEWAGNMGYYLEKSELLLSSQEGIIRTEKVSDVDRYNYEALKSS